jgi:hypothetical protein
VDYVHSEDQPSDLSQMIDSHRSSQQGWLGKAGPIVLGVDTVPDHGRTALHYRNEALSGRR